MEIKFNDKKLDLAPGTTLASLLVSQNLYPKSGLAVAINNEVVPRGKWETTSLFDGASILVIGATYGG